MSDLNPKKPAIFLIEDDDDARLGFRKLFKESGYEVLLAIDEEDALQRVAGGQLKADLIIIDLTDKSAENALELGRLLRRQGELNAPLIILPEHYTDEMEGKNIQVGENEYFAYLGQGHELLTLLESLTK